jgi:hypothetical protein
MEEALPALRALFYSRVFTKECTIRWKIIKDANKEDEIKIRYHLNLVF